jgi:hydroxymethylbilane synthase
VNLPSGSPTGKTPNLRIGTRGSPLALAQAQEVRRRLAAARECAEEALAIHIVKTTGDIIQDRPLREAGGKGLFTKELDLALLRGDIDIAVHSAKDLPTLLPEDIDIIGYLPREDVRDAWICREARDPRELAAGAVVGTASLRRAAMLKRLNPAIDITLLRGNVETRLAKVEKGEITATLLAAAGLKRLGLGHKATTLLDPAVFVPAVGQGAIAVTARRTDADTRAFAMPIFDTATEICLRSERALLRILDGSCRTPIGGLAELAGGELRMHAIILRPDGSQAFEAHCKGPPTAALTLGECAARDLLARAPRDFFKD